MDKKNFLDLFNNRKPIIAMLHLKGNDDADVFDRFKKELQIYIDCGIDAVLVETYFGKYHNMCETLEYLNQTKPIIYGVNCLNVDHMGFYLAKKYEAAFVQIDSVVGHVKPRDEESLQAFFDVERADYDGYLLGGVRFKYQPVLSERTLAEDLEIAKTRCDVICVTQDRTGQETSMEKISEFRNILKDFPLLVAAGVNDGNIRESLKVTDGAIIGSFFKDTYKDDGDVCAEHVERIMKIVSELRRDDS
jgi:hypothetical protein